MPTLTPASPDTLTLTPVNDGGTGYAGFYPSSSTYPSSSLYPGPAVLGTSGLAFSAFTTGTATAGTFSSMYPAEVFGDNPRTYYRMDATAGTSELDRGSLRHDGTYSNSPSLGQTGAISNSTAVEFTRTSSQILTGSDDDAYSISTTGELTVEWWAKFSVASVTAGSERAVSKMLTLADREWVGGRDVNGHFFRVLYADGSGNFLADLSFGTPSLNSFHHYVATMENNAGTVTVNAYLDGVLVDTDTFALASYVAGTGRVCVGGADDGTNYCNGTLDEVAIYSTALSAERVAAHYNQTPYFSAATSGTLTLTPA